MMTGKCSTFLAMYSHKRIQWKKTSHRDTTAILTCLKLTLFSDNAAVDTKYPAKSIRPHDVVGCLLLPLRRKYPSLTQNHFCTSVGKWYLCAIRLLVIFYVAFSSTRPLNMVKVIQNQRYCLRAL